MSSNFHNKITLAILNIININHKSKIKEISIYEKGFLEKIILKQKLSYTFCRNNLLNNDFFNIKIEIRDPEKLRVYKLHKYNMSKNTILKSFYLFLSFVFLKYIWKNKDLYLISYNAKKLLIIDQINLLSNDLIYVSKLLKIRYFVSNLLEITFLIMNSKIILKKGNEQYN